MLQNLGFLLTTLLLIKSSLSQCPWAGKGQRDDLQTACLCAYNLGQELSVQCDQVSILINSPASKY
jgi:hypothetical protein